MTVQFYKNASNPKAFEKTLTPIGSGTTLLPYEPITDISGRILVAYDASTAAANYCTLDGVPYFITDRQQETGQRMWIYVRKDVLSMYADQILQCPAVLANAETTYNAYSRGQIPTASYMQQQVKLLGALAFDSAYILVSVG